MILCSALRYTCHRVYCVLQSDRLCHAVDCHTLSICYIHERVAYVLLCISVLSNREVALLVFCHTLCIRLHVHVSYDVYCQFCEVAGQKE